MVLLMSCLEEAIDTILEIAPLEAVLRSPSSNRKG
jgi:hypothetical protein